MLRSAYLLATFSLCACASAPVRAVVVGDDLAPVTRETASPRVEASTDAAAWAFEGATEAPAEPVPARVLEPVPPLAEQGLHESRFTVKAGYWGSDEDTLDDGYIFSASWMRFFTPFFALEFEAGYLDSDGEDGGVDVDVWSIPVFLNGRLNAPLWILDVYGGAGVGGFYYDAEVSAGGLSADDDGFLLGGNVFVGATINLADALALGLEGKYYLSEDIDDADEGLNGYALMLTLGFGR